LVSVVSDLAFDAKGVAAEFVKARRAGSFFTQYPGSQPQDLDSAYRCQDEAIALWDEPISGWKVGWIPEPLSHTYGAQRLVGPIFNSGVQRSNGSATIDAPVFAQGFAAVEAEFIVQLAKDAPANVTEWTTETARRFVKAMYIGIEIASSPLQNINDYGPAVVTSDFGNNAGLILGKPIPDWRTRGDDWPPCETWVDGKLVGRGAPSSIPGGPPASLAFLMNAVAARGRPLKRGQLVTTGAASGIHDIEAGQTARITFADLDEIRCIAHPAQPARDGAPGGEGQDHGHGPDSA
jgi:2-keto-4-pentenoate hydratase